MDNSKKIRWNKKSAVISVLLIAAILVTGALAFLTARDSKTNVFTVGNVAMLLQEPNWNQDSEAVKHFLPTSIIEKDPQVQNTGSSKAWVFMTVDVPTSNHPWFDETTNTRYDTEEGDTYASNIAYYELFSLLKSNQMINKKAAAANALAGLDGNASDSWVLFYVDDSHKTPAAGHENEGYVTYYYAYAQELDKNETTTPLFDHVQAANLIEDETPTGHADLPVNVLLEQKAREIHVKAYAIQSDSTRNNPLVAWNTLSNQKGLGYQEVTQP